MVGPDETCRGSYRLVLLTSLTYFNPGDGLADYIIRYDGGAVKAFRNNGNLSPDGGNWVDFGTITSGVGADGRKLQFADVDGTLLL